MSDSVEEVKVEETQNVVAEVTGVTESVQDDLIEKIKRDLGLEVDEKTEKQDGPKKSEEITAEVVEDMKAQVEQLEAQKAELENATVKVEAQEESEEDNEAADTPDEEESEEGDVEEEDDEEEEGEVEDEEDEEDDEEEEGEVEEEEETEEEKRVRYMAIVIREKNNEIPFPIMCAGSLLVIIYMFKAFLILCAMTGCNKNCVCLA